MGSGHPIPQARLQDPIRSVTPSALEYDDMKRTTTQKRAPLNEEIDVRAFKDIQIRFPGDVYILAVWLAMLDRSKTTPTSQPHTTLHGLASNFASLYGIDYSSPLTSNDVMDVFRQHGITGNPWLRLEATADENPSLPGIDIAAGRFLPPIG
jgi:hypothetical protein